MQSPSDRQRMNPHTVERLSCAFRLIESQRIHGPTRGMPVHVLDIGYHARHPETGKPMWTSTVYRAKMLGYLRQSSPGMYVPTTKLWDEVARIEAIRAEAHDLMPNPPAALRLVRDARTMTS